MLESRRRDAAVGLPTVHATAATRPHSPVLARRTCTCLRATHALVGYVAEVVAGVPIMLQLHRSTCSSSVRAPEPPERIPASTPRFEPGQGVRLWDDKP